MDWLFALLTLTAMEIVLGIDNIVFISILVGRLPESQRASARTLGLAAAMVTRILLLLSLNWVLSLNNPVFELTDLGVPESWIHALEPGPRDAISEEALKELSAERYDEINGISVRDLILLVGGLFLIGNSVIEIHHKIEGHADRKSAPQTTSYGSVLVQIAILDIIFSLDSVITAVGMAKQIWVMATAIVLAVGVMMLFAGSVERFVSRYPTVKMLALSFLILIGVLLVAEGVGTPINKGYIYFAMAFSLIVELLNMRLRRTVHSEHSELEEAMAP